MTDENSHFTGAIDTAQSLPPAKRFAHATVVARLHFPTKRSMRAIAGGRRVALDTGIPWHANSISLMQLLVLTKCLSDLQSKLLTPVWFA